MTPEQLHVTSDQVQRLLELLERIATRQFTITQASDWPMIVFLSVIGIAMVGFMWRDLGKKLDSNAKAAEASLAESKKILTGSLVEHKQDNLREHDKIWSALRDCQDDCCKVKQENR